VEEEQLNTFQNQKRLAGVEEEEQLNTVQNQKRLAVEEKEEEQLNTVHSQQRIAVEEEDQLRHAPGASSEACPAAGSGAPRALLSGSLSGPS